MGVKGLTTFLKENRSISRSLNLDTSSAGDRERTPIVIDAWGLIFRLYHGSLPWTAGGEYLAFYRLVRRLLNAWKGVGLDMLFVFDGAPPPEKHGTIVSRYNENITSTQLFYATSPLSRSSQAFSRNSAHSNSILPPFCSHVFIQTVHDCSIKTHFVPLGEADGVCAVLAERLGGYVMGQDSDFVILIGEGRGARGYIPFDGMSWFEGPSDQSGMGEGEGSTSGTPGDEEFTTVSTIKPRRPRESPLLPPSDYLNPTLNITYYPPSALRTRLRIPSNVLPLFASLCGTDYTPAQASYHFFEPSQNLVSRIEKVARVLREQLYSPNVQSKGTAGDHAADLVTRVIKKLLVRPFYTESEGAALVDAIVDSTLQYTLPTLGRCCDYHPFCGALDQDRGCQSESVEGAAEGVRRFSKASESGGFRAARQGYFYPGAVFGYQVLEDPGRASIKAGGLVRVRKLAWEILDEALGLRFIEPEPEPEQESTSTPVDIDIQNGEGADLDKVLTTDGGSPNTLVDDKSDKNEDIDQAAVVDMDMPSELDIDLQSHTKTRVVIEFIRSSNRITPHTITLNPSTSTIRALEPLANRLRTYLTPLHSDTTLIKALPTHLQPIVAMIRFCILDSANWPGHEQSWRLPEIQAILKACLGTYFQWQREAAGDVPSKKELEMPYPLLTGRNAQLVAHLQATMTDSLILAESLLLSQNDEIGETLTHLQVYQFYSGQILHTFLNRHIPEGWKWRESDQATYDQCWTALVGGIEDKIVGYTLSTESLTGPSGEADIEEGVQEVKEGVVEKEIGKKRKKGKGKNGGGKTQKSAGNGGGGGRFDLLNGLND